MALLHSIESASMASRIRTHHPLVRITPSVLLFALATGGTYPAGPLLALMAGIGVTFTTLRPPFLLWLRLCTIPLAFLLMGALVLSFDPHMSLEDGFPLTLHLNPAGLQMALEATARSLASLPALFYIALSAPLCDWAIALQRLGLPRILTETIFLTHRFLFLLEERMQQLLLSQTSRLGYSSPSRARNSLALLTASLYRTSSEEVDRLERGLESRGFQGRLHLLTPWAPFSLTTFLLHSALPLLALALSMILSRVTL